MSQKNDLISRQAALDALDKIGSLDTNADMIYARELFKALPSAQPERPEQDILAWLLAYHTKSFDLNGRYMAHEVIGWLVHDFATAYMAEGREE